MTTVTTTSGGIESAAAAPFKYQVKWPQTFQANIHTTETRTHSVQHAMSTIIDTDVFTAMPGAGGAALREYKHIRETSHAVSVAHRSHCYVLASGQRAQKIVSTIRPEPSWQRHRECCGAAS